ncbi:MAG TPA: glycosyltransferase family A protein, partial [Flavobacteriales bacterium]|nr:glycosyltransferase family A protein [Flavobacteriales bacterium]
KNAIGEWVCFLDSDDLMLPNHLSTLSSAIECHKEINLFATYYDFLEGGKIQASPMKRYKEERYAYPLLLTGNPFACNITIRNFSPETIPFREERNLSSMEDWIFLFSNMWAQDLFLIGKCTIHMREHELRSMRNHDLI